MPLVKNGGLALDLGTRGLAERIQVKSERGITPLIKRKNGGKGTQCRASTPPDDFLTICIASLALSRETTCSSKDRITHALHMGASNYPTLFSLPVHAWSSEEDCLPKRFVLRRGMAALLIRWKPPNKTRHASTCHRRENGQADRPISTSPLNTLLCLHAWPITSWSSRGLIGKTRFGEGFTLRCFQRLSVPNIATRRYR